MYTRCMFALYKDIHQALPRGKCGGRDEEAAALELAPSCHYHTLTSSAGNISTMYTR
jgi:hypothetical protein